MNAYHYFASWPSRLRLIFRFLRFFGWTLFSLFFLSQISQRFCCAFRFRISRIFFPSSSPALSPLLYPFVITPSNHHRHLPILSNVKKAQASVMNCRIQNDTLCNFRGTLLHTYIYSNEENPCVSNRPPRPRRTGFPSPPRERPEGSQRSGPHWMGQEGCRWGLCPHRLVGSVGRPGHRHWVRF